MIGILFSGFSWLSFLNVFKKNLKIVVLDITIFFGLIKNGARAVAKLKTFKQYYLRGHRVLIKIVAQITINMTNFFHEQ